jgi:hypothetical protein
MDAIFSRTKIRVWRLTGTDTLVPEFSSAVEPFG